MKRMLGMISFACVLLLASVGINEIIVNAEENQTETYTIHLVYDNSKLEGYPDNECTFTVQKGNSLKISNIPVNKNDHIKFNIWSQTKDDAIGTIEGGKTFSNHIPTSDETWYAINDNVHFVHLIDEVGYFKQDDHERDLIVVDGDNLWKNNKYNETQPITHWNSSVVSNKVFYGWCKSKDYSEENLYETVGYDVTITDDVTLYAWYKDTVEVKVDYTGLEWKYFNYDLQFNFYTDSDTEYLRGFKGMSIGENYTRKPEDAHNFWYWSNRYLKTVKPSDKENWNRCCNEYFNVRTTIDKPTGYFIGWVVNDDENNIISTDEINDFVLEKDSYTFTPFYSENPCYLGHNYSDEYTVDVGASCTEEGVESRHCTRCSESIDSRKISPHGHRMDSWRETVFPTCEEKGEMVNYCSICGFYGETKDIPANGHNWTNWYVSYQDKYTGYVEETRTCTTCYKEEKINYTVPLERQAMYRLYNPYSGEHFYTSNADERNNLTRLGWNYEGIGWYAPKDGRYPVYRIYNPIGGEHHYTLNVDEKNNLVRLGWKDEGIGWYSADSSSSESIPVKREYNPNAFANNHNYTISLDEHNWLVGLGWKDEGTGWFALK